MVYWWFWLAIIILAIVIEIFTEQLVSIWFIPGALISIIFDLFEAKLVWQIIIFLALSVVGIIVGKKFLLKYKSDNSTKTNIDAIIGEKCIVTEKIDNFAGCGQAKVRGQIWSARGVLEDDVFEPGEVLQIVAIEGVKIICKKI